MEDTNDALLELEAITNDINDVARGLVNLFSPMHETWGEDACFFAFLALHYHLIELSGRAMNAVEGVYKEMGERRRAGSPAGQSAPSGTNH